MRRVLPNAAVAIGLMACAAPASAERLVTSLSNYRVSIASNFTGTDLVLFGTIDRDATTVPRRGGYDVVVTVRGPRQSMVTWRKERMFGIWVNAEQRTFVDAPSYLAVLANRPVDLIAGTEQRRRLQLGLDSVVLPQQGEAPPPQGEGLSQQTDARAPADAAEGLRDDPFRQAFIRMQSERGAYFERANALTFLTPTLFRTAITLRADAPIGTYEVDVKLFADGTLLAREPSAFELYKVGIEQVVATAARNHGLLYGLSTAGLALMIGWFATVIFRRD
jgi:uncharacterized protein (TIGR02186 family)